MEAVIKKKKHGRISVSQIAIVVVLVIFVFLLLFPIYLLLTKSVKTITQDQQNPFGISFPFNWENYAFAWLYVKDLFLNTVILTVANIVGTTTICCITAYAYTRFRFPGKEVIFTIIISIMMIPGILTLVAQFLLADALGLVGSRWGVILPEMAGNIPFNLFLLRTFFKGVPNDLFEAAEIDGASDLRMFGTIMIPLSMPIVMTVAIMLMMQSWNDLIWPQLILNEDQANIASGLIPFTDWYYAMNNTYTAPMAGYVITSLPLIILFAFTSKQFVSGLTSGAFKM